MDQFLAFSLFAALGFSCFLPAAHAQKSKKTPVFDGIMAGGGYFLVVGGNLKLVNAVAVEDFSELPKAISHEDYENILTKIENGYRINIEFYPTENIYKYIKITEKLDKEMEANPFSTAKQEVRLNELIEEMKDVRVSPEELAIPRKMAFSSLRADAYAEKLAFFEEEQVKIIKTYSMTLTDAKIVFGMRAVGGIAATIGVWSTISDLFFKN